MFNSKKNIFAIQNKIMRKIAQYTVLLLCISITFVSNAQQKEKEKDKKAKAPVHTIKPITDFRDIFWGSPIDSTYRDGEKVNFVLEKEEKGEKFYILEGDKMQIGAVPLKSIHYFFDSEGRFNKVLFSGDKKDVEQMKFILEYKYEKPKDKEETDEISYYEWQVKLVKVLLADYNQGKFDVVITSNVAAIENYKKNTHVDDF